MRENLNKYRYALGELGHCKGVKSPQVNYKYNTASHLEKLMYKNSKENHLKKYNCRNLTVRHKMPYLVKIIMSILEKLIQIISPFSPCMLPSPK